MSSKHVAGKFSKKINLQIMPIQTVNPFNNEIVKTFQEMSPEEVETAVAQSEKAFKDWRKTKFHERSDLMRGVAKLMRQKKDELAKLITLEMGKLIKQSYDEILLSADIFDYYADTSEHYLKDVSIITHKGEAFVRNSPLGIILGIEPWNYPFYQVARFASPNIMIGNVVIVKLASNVPQCAQAIDNLFIEAGAQKGVYTNLYISANRVADLVADRRIMGSSLTGSEQAGSSLASAAGKNIKKSVLELGGSDAFIVLGDVDVDQTVEWAVIGRMYNMGQSCVSSKRFILLDSIADEFINKFKKKMSELMPGDPMDPDTKLGPLSSEKAAEQLIEQVTKSVEAGAKLLLGGKRINRPGAFVEPSILTNIKPGVPAYYEELFGPVASVYRVRNEQESIDLANDSPFGLGGSVFSRDVERAKRVADQIETGMVFINHPASLEANLPFGGIKQSGYGRELSWLGLEEFVNRKLFRIREISDKVH